MDNCKHKWTTVTEKDNPNIQGNMTFCLECGKIHEKHLAVKTEENIAVSENLFNFKRWFNGMKKFSIAKISPPTSK